MALSESGLAAQGVIGTMIYGPAGSRKPVKAKRGPARSSVSIRGGRKQSYYVRPKGR
jgi:hypothetical protein